jgi:hypothetical protein
MKAKVIAVRAPEHLIDLGLKSNVDGVLRFLDHGIEYHEPASIFQYAKYFFHHSLGIVKVMQAKRHKGAIERFRFKWQSVGFTGALIVGGNRILVLVADVEHGERLINTDDPAALEALCHRPSHSTGTRRHVENLFIALQNEHFSQFLGEISTDPRGSAIKLRRVLRVMEMSLVPMAMPMFMTVAVLVVMSALVIMGVLMPMFVSVIMSVFMFVAVLGIVIMLVTLIMNVRMAVALFMTMLMVVTVLPFVIMLMFVFIFFAHDFIPSLSIYLRRAIIGRV